MLLDLSCRRQTLYKPPKNELHHFSWGVTIQKRPNIWGQAMLKIATFFEQKNIVFMINCLSLAWNFVWEVGGARGVMFIYSPLKFNKWVPKMTPYLKQRRYMFFFQTILFGITFVKISGGSILYLQPTLSQQIFPPTKHLSSDQNLWLHFFCISGVQQPTPESYIRDCFISHSKRVPINQSVW